MRPLLRACLLSLLRLPLQPPSWGGSLTLPHHPSPQPPATCSSAICKEPALQFLPQSTVLPSPLPHSQLLLCPRGLFTPSPHTHQCPRLGSGRHCPSPSGNMGTCTRPHWPQGLAQRSSCRTRSHPERSSVCAISQTAAAPGIETHPP